MGSSANPRETSRGNKLGACTLSDPRELPDSDEKQVVTDADDML